MEWFANGSVFSATIAKFLETRVIKDGDEPEQPELQKEGSGDGTYGSICYRRMNNGNHDTLWASRSVWMRL